MRILSHLHHDIQIHTNHTALPAGARPSPSRKTMTYASYLPDELLLEILLYIEAWDTLSRQSSLARFVGVNRQWYDVGVSKLYERPYLAGRAYELFVRTVCPSVLAHIKPSALSGLVRELDLSHIVHHSTRSTTARAYPCLLFARARTVERAHD
jgi:hypothetical protein